VLDPDPGPRAAVGGELRFGRDAARARRGPRRIDGGGQPGDEGDEVGRSEQPYFIPESRTWTEAASGAFGLSLRNIW
jgi:hypothetical protein